MVGFITACMLARLVLVKYLSVSSKSLRLLRVLLKYIYSETRYILVECLFVYYVDNVIQSFGIKLNLVFNFLVPL